MRVSASLLVPHLAALLLVFAAMPAPAWAGPLDPALEQEFSDAKRALDAARKLSGDEAVAALSKQADEFLRTAEEARSGQAPVQFARSVRLARSYAEFAVASSELNAVTAQLATADDDLRKTKAEIERLTKLK